MKSQLYLPETTRRYLKSEISDYVEIYSQKLLPVFKNIESDADKYENDFYDNFMSQPAYNGSIDPSSIAEEALEIGIEHYSYLKLGKYSLTATWHATLYQVWEQQSRSFLFNEMSHVYNIQFETFCTELSEIKKAFKLHNVDIESFSCWPQIRELSLLCNVIKHGDGDSAKRLRKIKPALFKQEAGIDYMKTFKTTLLEETLNINEMTLQNYREALLSFWDEIPERNYSDEL
ncbi:MAG: hypothetical protein MUP69_07300 [Candidatus Atribacteria bacterium]|nr:hypothetical protein [Candidatus Atribacteria bacterium]